MRNRSQLLIVEITEKTIGILALDGKNKIVDYSCYELSRDLFQHGCLSQEEQITVVLKKYREAFLPKRKVNVNLLVPLQHGFIKEFQLPWFSPRKRGQALQYLMADEIPIALTELSYDYIFQEDREEKRIYCCFAALRREIAARYRSCVQNAGFRVIGMEFSITAFSGILQYKKVDSVLYIREESPLQLIIYKNSMPAVVRSIQEEPLDIQRYLIFLGLQELSLPVDYLISDHKISADTLQHYLNDGIASRQICLEDMEFWDEHSQELITQYGSSVYCVLGARLNTIYGKHRQLNFYQEYQETKRKNLQIGSTAAIVLGIALFTMIYWAPLYIETQKLEQQYRLIEQSLEEVQKGQEAVIFNEWHKVTAASSDHISRLPALIAYQADHFKVKRFNVKQNKIYMDLACQHNTDISAFTDYLLQNGCGIPTITNYRYDAEHGIDCSITVDL